MDGEQRNTTNLPETATPVLVEQYFHFSIPSRYEGTAWLKNLEPQNNLKGLPETTFTTVSEERSHGACLPKVR